MVALVRENGLHRRSARVWRLLRNQVDGVGGIVGSQRTILGCFNPSEVELNQVSSAGHCTEFPVALEQIRAILYDIELLRLNDEQLLRLDFL